MRSEEEEEMRSEEWEEKSQIELNKNAPVLGHLALVLMLSLLLKGFL